MFCYSNNKKKNSIYHDITWLLLSTSTLPLCRVARSAKKCTRKLVRGWNTLHSMNKWPSPFSVIIFVVLFILAFLGGFVVPS